MRFSLSPVSARLALGARVFEHTRAVQLTILVLASALIYVRAFVLPYNLLDYWDQPELTIAKIARDDGSAGFEYVVAFIALFVAYALAMRITARTRHKLMWLIVIVGAVMFNFVMLWLYPVDSADIFDNIMRGRIQARYHANPFYDTPVQFLADPFRAYIAWDHIPSAYGPGWEIVAALTTHLAGDAVLANVLAFKLVSIIAYAGTAVVIALTLQCTAPTRALLGVTVFAWNPFAIYVIAGNGHNDAVMLFFLALGFFFLAHKHFSLAALAHVLGALVKFIPILLVPVILLAGVKHLRGWQARMRFIGVTVIACTLITLLAYAPYWRGGDILGTKWRANNFTTSLPALIQVSLIPGFGKAATNALVSRAALGLLALWIARELWLTWQRNDANQFIHAGLSILIFYLLVACLWVQAWYAVWLLPLVALAPRGTLARGALLASFCLAMKMPIFDFILGINENHLSTREVREWQITLATLGPLWMYLGWSRLQTLVRAR